MPNDDSRVSIPRTLMLTLWPPDAKYKILRRYADMFPPERLSWYSLQECAAGHRRGFRHRAFLPRRLHWRLHGRWLGQLYFHGCQSARLASAMADDVRDFDPEVIWALPELGAADMAYRLSRTLGLPLHLTAHDAHETAWNIVPRLYYPFYARSVNRAFRCADSVDAICGGMLEHLKRLYGNITDANGMVFHPSIDEQLVTKPVPTRAESWRQGRTRRIGLCGSMRVSERQWRSFLEGLGTLPYEVVIVAFAFRDRFFTTEPPPNVRIELQSFAQTEADVIADFHRHGVDACYLGLWHEESQGLFGRTSLSAKLVTYAAASLPIIVHARPDSEAWRLVKAHGAGVLVGPDHDMAGLGTLFADAAAWNDAARGAGELARSEFNARENLVRLWDRLSRTAARR
jgi:hypothetical protein